MGIYGLMILISHLCNLKIKFLKIKILTHNIITQKNLVDFLSGYIEPQKIINFDKFAKFLALADIFGSWHGNETSNLRLYFNPYNQLLEPIPDDMFDEPRDKPSRDFAIFKIRNIGVFYFLRKTF